MDACKKCIPFYSSFLRSFITSISQIRYYVKSCVEIINSYNFISLNLWIRYIGTRLFYLLFEEKSMEDVLEKSE